MALPPKGDPRRPLHLAVRSTRVLGVLFVGLGLCGMFPFLLSGVSVRGVSGLLVTFVAAFYFLPGLLYILFSIYLRAHKLWAVIGSLVLASIQLLVVLLGLAGVLIASVMPHADFGTALLLPLLAGLIVGAALAQLIYHLALSIEAIKYPPYGQEFHGFMPVMAQPAVPPAAPPTQLPTE